MALCFVIHPAKSVISLSTANPAQHAETSRSPSESVALGPEVLPVAGAAEHLAVVLGDAAGVEHLAAHGWKKKSN